ncbi:MAG: hypothetical protein JNJ65_12555 [Cyclobacteriaceae bacterium]|nr:hypothetical protein [Cyclobacteriaceae bacterium]
MNKRFLLLVLALFTFACVSAQAPKGINYQGVARDNEGKPIATQTISVRINILKNSATGEVEYSEIHKLQTNQFGLFTLVIGQGTTTSGDFAFVSWAIGTKWLQIEIDPDGGSSFQLAGSQQLMSVPYAFYSEYSGNGLTAGTGIDISNNQIHNTGDGDSSSSNELITEATLTSEGKLKITEAGTTKEVDLSPLAGGFLSGLQEVLNQSNDAAANRITNLGAPVGATDAATKAYVDAHADGDASNTNEIQDLTFSNNMLRITQNPGATTIDLTPLLDNTDNQVLSLMGTNLSISNGNQVNLSSINTDTQNLLLGSNSGTNRTINITNGTGVTIDVADNDNSVTNEIQDLNLTGNNLKITNNTAASTIDLSPFAQTLTLLGNSLSISNGNSVDLSSFATDNQNLSLGTAIGTSKVINISNGTGVTIDVADNDNSSTNELQNLSLGTSTGTNRVINIAGGTGVTIDVADTDNNPSNEIQDLSLVGNNLRITDNSGASTINLAPYLDNTDNQNLSLSGTNLSITGGNLVDISSINTDNQTLSLSGTNLSISNGNLVNLSSINTDNQNLSLGTSSGTNRTINISNGTGVTIDVNDGDNNSTNEIQSISRSGATVSLSLSGGSITLPDDSPTNEIQDLSINPSNNVLSLTGDVTTVDLSSYKQSLSYDVGTGNLTISGGTPVNISPTLNRVLTTNANAGGLRIQNLGTPTIDTDAVTKKYVDDADALLSSRLSTTYAFKVNFSYNNSSGTITNNQDMIFNSEEFDNFNVAGTSAFTASEAGTYVFMVDGIYNTGTAGGQLSILYNSVKYPISIILPFGATLPRYNATFMFQLTPGQTVKLVGDNVAVGATFTGQFFGYKL